MQDGMDNFWIVREKKFGCLDYIFVKEILQFAWGIYKTAIADHKSDISRYRHILKPNLDCWPIEKNEFDF